MFEQLYFENFDTADSISNNSSSEKHQNYVQFLTKPI